MRISTSILLRTLVWLTCFITLLAVGILPLFLDVHPLLTVFVGLFVIFLAQGFASLIPTRKEIRNKEQII